MIKKQLLELLNKLTIDEKIDMVHGCELFSTKPVKRLGIPAFKSSDGPMGVRLEYEPSKWTPIDNSSDYTSYLQSNSALAATFNRELSYASGQVLGLEARGRGKDMILAPGINIQRSPLCGRNFEYMSEDPYLSGEMAVPYIRGIEESDVSACVKHFALNNQETRRMDVNVKVSERALFEIYLPAFRAAVKEGKAHGMMGSYNRYQETFCCHHPYLLDEILRKEWKFDGIVISDWGGVHDMTEALQTSLDMEMSVTDDFDAYFMADNLREAIEKEPEKEAELDKKVMHILNVMNDLHMLDGERISGTYNQKEAHETLLKTAEESIILLKNDASFLPLSKNKIKKLVVIGDNGDRLHANGGGSAEIKALYEISPLLGLNMLLGGNCEVIYEPGYYARVVGNVWDEDTTESWQATSLNQDIDLAIKKNLKLSSEDDKQINTLYRERAKKAALEGDAVIFIGGLNHDYDVEGRDRDNMMLPYEQDSLIKELLAIRPDMIVTMISGSPVDMSAWMDEAKTILYSSYNGMEGGFALAEVIFGIINPSGKLPITFPKKLEDTPSYHLGEFPGNENVTYEDDIYVGYRYFDTFHVKPAFPFGFGLSYTTFDYRDLSVKLLDQEADLECTVELVLTNSGPTQGKETVQIYVMPDADSIPKRPSKELRNFDKITLNPKEEKKVTLSLSAYSFSYYDEERHCYIAKPGKYTICAAASSQDIRLTADIVLTKEYVIAR